MNIYEAICNVMSEIGAIGKTSKSTQGYNYRGIDSVMNALNPALIKNRICIVPEILEHTREERQTAKGGLLIYSICKIKYHFIADDGSQIECTVMGEGMDSSDKSSNKAMSNAFKYACFQTFCIPTEEMLDSEAGNPIAEADSKVEQTNVVPITEYLSLEQKEQIIEEMKRTKTTREEIAKLVGANSFDEIPKSVFAKLYKSMCGWETK